MFFGENSAVPSRSEIVDEFTACIEQMMSGERLHVITRHLHSLYKHSRGLYAHKPGAGFGVLNSAKSYLALLHEWVESN